MTFRPTIAPAGRLMRLGVVLDTRNRPERLREIVRMCQGAWIPSLWVHDHLADDPTDPTPRLEAWTVATLASDEAADPTIGVHVVPGRRDAATLATMATTLDAASGGRLELCFAAKPEPGTDVARYVREVRGRLAAEASVAGGDEALVRLSVEAHAEEALAVAVELADDALLSAWMAGDLGDAIRRIRVACERGGRDPTTLGIALEAPVSIGRTTAEAGARVSSESLFSNVGSPADVGVFGTLEQCQKRIIELAHGGITDLRCVIPNSPDVHDVIAQLTAMVHGSTELLTPGAPRSKAPDPPETWGGRSRVR